MFVKAYAQAIDVAAPAATAAPPPAHRMAFWVGVFDAGSTPPGPIAARINGNPVEVTVTAPFARLPDSGNHWRALIEIAAPCAAPEPVGAVRIPFRVTISVGADSTSVLSRPLPLELPANGGEFRILLASCYYRPNDQEGLLTRCIDALPRPDLTVLAGDQVYLDLPVHENLPTDDALLRRTLGLKYRRNFASESLGEGRRALAGLLDKAPVVCLPDDHEYWNNYPYPQAQLPDTWTNGHQGRERWARAAADLYAAYQCNPLQAQSGVRRIDVAPLRMLFIDLRSRRKKADDPSNAALFTAQALAALNDWTAALLQDRQAGRRPIGVLSSGQILFLDRPEELHQRIVDAEMPNYKAFDRIHEALHRLSQAQVPVVYLSGDVHWGRIVRADLRTSTSPPRSASIYEVIASPSTLIDQPGDSARRAWGAVRDLFSDDDPWPTHAAPPDPPRGFGPADHRKRYALTRWYPTKSSMKLGNHVAMLCFKRRSNGVALQVEYHRIHRSPRLSLPLTAPEIFIPA